MAGKTWRDSAAPIIAEVIKSNPGVPTHELKKLISEKYPFGVRDFRDA
jgi:hypothetical protein